MAKKKSGKPAAPESANHADLGEIARFLAFMEEHGLEELEYQRADLHVRLKRPEPSSGGVPLSHVQASPSARTASSASPAPAEAASTVPALAPQPASDNLHTVKSPIVGTFYAAPSPDAPPFVNIGDLVKRGQVLCIVEAMKLMNEIEADQGGEIVRQLAENGQPVEYGQPLFALRPMSD
jgi:acetyl-CoA carboxylase biotin carboxyl carrier protein